MASILERSRYFARKWGPKVRHWCEKGINSLGHGVRSLIYSRGILGSREKLASGLVGGQMLGKRHQGESSKAAVFKQVYVLLKVTKTFQTTCEQVKFLKNQFPYLQLPCLCLPKKDLPTYVP